MRKLKVHSVTWFPFPIENFPQAQVGKAKCGYIYVAKDSWFRESIEKAISGKVTCKTCLKILATSQERDQRSLG